MKTMSLKITIKNIPAHLMDELWRGMADQATEMGEKITRSDNMQFDFNTMPKQGLKDILTSAASSQCQISAIKLDT